MAGKEQNLGGLLQQIAIGIASSFVIIVIINALTIPWLGVLSGVVVLVVVSLIIYRRNERLIKLLRSGWSPGCYYTFPAEENPKIWTQAQLSFKYLGISGATILERFRDWTQNLPQNSPLEFKLLLMNPDAQAIPAQEAFRLALSQQDPKVIQDVNVTRKKIQTSIEALKALDIYSRGKLKIKLYDELIPWWIYIFDDAKAYVGVLESGKSSLDSPVLMLKKHHRFSNIFDSFEMNWDRMWEQAHFA
jgi:hypothetical protein